MLKRNFLMEPEARIGVRYNAAIGEVVAKFNLMEQTVIFLISKILNVHHENVWCLVGADQFSDVILKFKKAVHSKIKDRHPLKQFDKLCADLKTANEDRNKYLHSIYTRHNRVVYRGKMLRHVKRFEILESHPVTIKELKDYIERIHGLTQRSIEHAVIITKLIKDAQEAPN